MSISIRDLAKDVEAVDIYRATDAGLEGAKLNDAPITGTRYFDETAEPGVQYYYTVKVARRIAATSGSTASRFVTADVFPQVKADVIKARHARQAPEAKGGAELPMRDAIPSKSAPSAPAASEALSQMTSVTYGAGAAVATLTANTTWTAAGGPYFIRSDLVVPAGKTLTVMPGAKVYFDTAASGEDSDTPFPGVQSVTDKIDLIVHGKIVAKGTSANPIVFTSINSLVASATATLANRGDWGCVFTDSLAASEISYSQVEFGIFGTWGHKTNRPYISNSTFMFIGQNSGDYNYPSGAVNFTASPAASTLTPRARITGNKITVGSSNARGICVLNESLGTSTADRVVDPYIASNTVNSPSAVYLYSDETPAGLTHGGKYANVTLKGSIVNNKLTSDVGSAVFLYAFADGADHTATISTALSGNTIVGSSTEAVYVEVQTAGLGGDAYAKPTFYRDKITSVNEDAVFVEALSDYTGVTSLGNAYATPTFTYCQVRSTAGDSVGLYGDAAGKGTALANGVFYGGTLQTTSDNGVDAYAQSELGSASASPSFTNVVGRGWNANEFVYAYAYCPGAGAAKASPRWVGGSNWASAGDCIYAYSQSEEGSAESRPYVSAAEFRAYGYGIDAEAYASHGGTGAGSANASSIVSNSDVIASYSEAVYGYAQTDGTGSATCSPAILNSSLVAEEDYGVEAYAYSDGGAATASPVLTDSTLWTYDCALYGYAYRYGDETRTANVTVSPRLTRSTLISKYYEPAYLEAFNYGVGNATVKPVVYSSDVINSYDDDGMYGYAEVNTTGTAEASPVMTGSNFKSDYIAADFESQANGAGAVAKTNGTYTNCTFSSAFDDGFYGYTDSEASTCEVKPTFTNCTVEAPNDYAYEIDAEAGGADAKSVTAAPTISGGRIPYSGDGIYVEAYSGYDGATTTVLAAPRILNLPLVSHWDYGISTAAATYGNGNATNNSYIYNSPTSSYYGIYNEAAGYGNAAGNAYNNAKTLGVSSARRMRLESFDYYGIFDFTYSSYGNAYDRTQQKYLSVSSADGAVYSNTSAELGSGKNASAMPLIYGIASDMLWGSDDNAIYVSGYASGGDSTSTVSPNISNNTIGGSFGDGIYVQADGSGVQLASPTISGNTITAAHGNAIFVISNGGAPQVTKNSITRPYLLGIYLDKLPGGTVSQNKIVDPGWGYDGADEWNTSCLAWFRADPSKAIVKGNMFIGSRGTAVYYEDGAARTNYNSFSDAYGAVNRPFNYWSNANATSTITPYDARYNWWGTTSSAAISDAINVPNYSAGPKTDIVNFTSPLSSRQPKVVSIGVAKTATRVRLTVRFDRPMDTSVRTLYFGATSPYRTYAVSGTWNSAGTVFTGTRARSGLPTGRNLYFSGAKDLPGNLMLSTSKAFRL